jgi:hypothetical protein
MFGAIWLCRNDVVLCRCLQGNIHAKALEFTAKGGGGAVVYLRSQ